MTSPNDVIYRPGRDSSVIKKRGAWRSLGRGLKGASYWNACGGRNSWRPLGSTGNGAVSNNRLDCVDADSPADGGIEGCPDRTAPKSGYTQ